MSIRHLTGAVVAAALACSPLAFNHASAAPAGKAPASTTVATPERPYASDSLWYAQPVNPVFDDWQIPDTSTGWWATVGNGNYGIGVFEAQPSDPEMVVHALEGCVWQSDPEACTETVTIPHFPADTLPPAGTDGTVSLIDASLNRVYTFWQLRHGEDGLWRAKQLSWEPLDGQGWGDPAHYFRGSSAAGNGQLGGLIREDEYRQVDEPMYHHALTATLDNTGLKAGVLKADGEWTVDYVFPATSGDGWGPQPSGNIPEGALLMLPKDFDVESLPSRELRKVARTLQVYGARVVDRNHGVPLTIGAANGFTYDLGDEPYDDPALDDAGDWEKWAASGVGQAMDEVRRNVRMVVDQDGYLTADGQHIDPVPGRDVNLLSLRGPWTASEGGALGSFDTYQQRLEFTEAGTTQTTSGRWERVKWATVTGGERLRLSVESTGKAGLRLQVSCGQRVAVDTGLIRGKQHRSFTWPSCAGAKATWTASSGEGNSWLSADLRRA